MSGRNFARAFRAETGQTPYALVSALLLEAARRALESSNKSVKHVAVHCGFGNAMALHRAFQRALHTTPLAYRSRFRTAPGAGEPDAP